MGNYEEYISSPTTTRVHGDDYYGNNYPHNNESQCPDSLDPYLGGTPCGFTGLENP